MKVSYQRFDSPPVVRSVATHDGIYHLDDVLAAAVVRKLYPQVAIVRTRDPAILKNCDLVFDVGGVCDLKRLRLDHHMSTGAPIRDDGIRYASIGLVWLVFGELYCRPLANEHELDSLAVARQVEHDFILAIDGLDNGQVSMTAEADSPSELSVPSLSGLIKRTRPQSIIGENPSSESLDAEFLRLAELMQTLVIDRWLATTVARLKTPHYVVSRADDSPILVLDVACPWKTTVDKLLPDVRYVVSPANEHRNEWSVTPIATRLDNAFPSSWLGKTGEELAEHTSIQADANCDGRLLFVVGKDAAIEYANAALYPKKHAAKTVPRETTFDSVLDGIVTEQQQRETTQRKRTRRRPSA